MKVGDPAYVALVDRMAAALRDQFDAGGKSLRRALFSDCLRVDVLLTSLLAEPDPLLAFTLYRDHLRQFLDVISDPP